MASDLPPARSHIMKLGKELIRYLILLLSILLHLPKSTYTFSLRTFPLGLDQAIIAC